MLKEWIRAGRERGASDLHLEAGTLITYRIRGELTSVQESTSGDQLVALARELLNAEEWAEFLAKKSYDFSRTLAGVRCRFNIYQTVRGVGFAIRLLSSFQNNLQDCNLHPDLKRFIEPRSGLVLISGATGSGKSTTLAALIEELNVSKRKNIVILESPIEYYFVNRQSFIRHREIPTHSPSYEQALIDSMRENPDVLVIGEMRTPEVMRLTLNAAETGHLVLATMHSSTCAEAISRICMSFAPDVQASVRAQLGDSLVGAICQRLVYHPQAQVLVPQLEIMVANSAVKSNIRQGNLSQLASTIQTGGDDGMWSFDRYAKWMEQKKTWVRPQQAKALESAESLPAPNSSLREGAPRPPAHAPSAAKPSPTVARRGPPPRPPMVTSAEAPASRIEIDVPEEDLEEIARKLSTGDGSGSEG